MKYMLALFGVLLLVTMGQAQQSPTRLNPSFTSTFLPRNALYHKLLTAPGTSILCIRRVLNRFF